MEKKEIRTTMVQLIKYGIVGVSNSLITLIVIFLFNSVLNLSLLLADVVGYVAGVINSFIWNKQWVFKTHDTKLVKEMSLFVTGFLICFG
ncbi:MAG: GtrA family protein, partial [Muribaculaceae bacterium]|nr:GtrA family protein [Muribaculaceae bacterium]